MAKPRKGSKREKKNIPVGRCCIHATFNNTIITFTDMEGNAIAWASAGMAGFKGSRKGTPYAASLASAAAAQKAKDHGLREVHVEVKGPGSGRESALRALMGIGLTLKSIRDTTSIPHNGCRPPKRRRN